MLNAIFFTLGFFTGGIVYVRLYKQIEENNNNKVMKHGTLNKRTIDVEEHIEVTKQTDDEIKPWSIEDPKDKLEYIRREIEEVI